MPNLTEKTEDEFHGDLNQQIEKEKFMINERSETHEINLNNGESLELKDENESISHETETYTGTAEQKNGTKSRYACTEKNESLNSLGEKRTKSPEAVQSSQENVLQETSSSKKIKKEKSLIVEQMSERAKEDILKSIGKPKSTMKVQTSSQKCKLCACLFCKNKITKLSRHFLDKHSDKEEIKTLLSLPVNSQERKDFLQILRNKGNLDHNKTGLEDDELLVSRRVRIESQHTPKDYTSCPGSFQNILRTTVRHHKCVVSTNLNSHSILVEGVKLEARIHKSANERLRTEVVPNMKNDEITKAALFDELIVKTANSFEEKYAEFQNYIIRHYMRVLERILIEVKKL